MRRFIMALGVIGAVAAFARWWREHPRFGAGYVNRVIDPWLVRQGVIAESGGELGLIEHIGRVSGTVRQTPVHPVATEAGFRIVVPLGEQSEWARNVMTAGHCRLQVGSTIHELDEPSLVAPTRIEEIPTPLARTMEWLGFRYLVLHRYAEHEGSLQAPPIESTPTVGAPVEAEPVVAEVPAEEEMPPVEAATTA